MELSYDPIIPEIFLRNFKEDLWSDGELVRTAWSVGLPEAQPILQDILTKFPDMEEELLVKNQGAVGVASNYREPYINGCISWYSWDWLTDSDKNQFGVILPEGLTYKPWYGKKFDMTTGQVWLKVVYEENIYRPTYPKPNIPSQDYFFAFMYDEEKNLLPDVDVYFHATFDEMRRFCVTNGVTYPDPMPTNDKSYCLFSVVYDRSTLAISKVKAYVIDVIK